MSPGIADGAAAHTGTGRWSTSLTSSALSGLVDEARHLKPEIDRREPVLIGEGISTLAYALHAPGGDWVLRVCRDHPDPWTWRGGRAHEVELSGELRRRGVPVPADAVMVEEVDGLPTAILERRVVGTPLTPELIRADPQMTSKIAALLDRLHTFDVDTLTHGVPENDPVAGFRQGLTAVDLADADLQRRVEAAIAVLEARQGIRSLCHRDFRCDHLLVGEDGDLVGLLDLGDIGIDDPAIDLTFLIGDLGADTVAEICGAMTTADPDLGAAASILQSLWPLLELAPGGEAWGDPATARTRLADQLQASPT